MRTWLTFITMEAHVQYIVEPFEPKLVTLDTHTATVRRYIAVLHNSRNSRNDVAQSV